ncbi:major facilitator superfamily domain-containing protein [Rhodocollybia butyracea]|uniref:Major facilitator superfamily domain-containing protein n=1 Tax=Rhodocollybia butyracea TaxID=206335 RepID=A0A9P5PXH3_9AGAR|nr:major facilitator superfamily domain-containing protein [Rhodocollybia butyracea]
MTLSEAAVPPDAQISTLRKYTLLILFCLAQFLDVFNFAAIFVAIPAIANDLHIEDANTVWIVSAFQLTFASFLLVSGRISDIYDPKYCFVAGALILGVMSIGCGFVRVEVPLFVLRALGGIGASLTIPSAFGLIIRFFPEPNEQAIAIGAFGGSGAVGNALGVVFSALFVQFASWHWLFWFSALMAIPIAGICFLLIPSRPDDPTRAKASVQSLDIIGVSILTIALVLFIFALTSGSSVGWGTARVIAPLVISILMVVGFLFWETRVPEEYASLPPQMWRIPNFGVLFGISLTPYLWWTSTFLLITSQWQDEFLWSPIKSGIHFLPIGIPSVFLTVLAGYLTRHVKPKHLIIAGGILLITSTGLEPFSATDPTENRYWRFAFPAFILGTSGATLVYCGASVAMFLITPPKYAATVGAIFNAALQLGAAVGSAIISSIQSSITPGSNANSFTGRADGFWFLFAVVTFMTVSVAIFYRVGKTPVASAPDAAESSTEQKRSTEDTQA